MQKLKLISVSLASIAVATLSLSATAATSAPKGWYVEGNVGESAIHGKHTGGTLDDKGLGYNAVVGYKFIPYAGVEAGYTRYHTADVKTAGMKVGELKTYSYQIAGKGIYPIADSGFELFTKLGVAKMNSSFHVTNAALAGSGTGSESKTGVYFGLGGDYAFVSNAAVSLQWNRAIGGSSTGDLDLYSAGLTVMFG